MFYGPVHGAEEGAAVFYQAVKVNLLQKVALSLTEIIRVKPWQTEKKSFIRSEADSNSQNSHYASGVFPLSRYAVRPSAVFSADSNQTVNHTCGGTSSRSLCVSPPSASSGPG